MGNFYTQILACGATQSRCFKVMHDLKRRSVIAPPHRDIVTVLDASAEAQDVEELDSVAYTLANRLSKPTIAVVNHNNDLLTFRIFGPDGFRGYCRSGMFRGGACKDLKTACRASCSAPAIWFAFVRPHPFQISRHAHLVRLLDLPPWSVGLGFRRLSQGECEREIPAEQLLHT